VGQALRQHFGEDFFVEDKVIDGGCSKRRPDFMKDLLTHVLVIEVDENQHRDRNASCESAKLVAQLTDIGGRPLVVIHFNPDGYTSQGTRHLGCFRLDKATGGQRTRKNEWEWRCDVLMAQVKKCVGRVPSKMITEEWLFFNE